jgi:hypothetical protein
MMVCNAPDVYAHEMGHLVGHWHSGTPGGGEYSDTSDIMSRSLLPLRLFSGARRVLAGWTPSANVLNLTNSGTYTLDSTALSNSSNPQTLVLPKSSTGEKYFISFRTPISYDSTLNSGYLNRVSVHSGTTANALTYLHGTLGVGESYTDSANGYTFTVNSMSTNSASVSVTMPTQQVPVCTRSNPAVSLSPISQSAAPGNAITYQVTVTNKNSSACGTSSFSFTPQVPSGWSSSYAPTSLSLDPGVTASVAWTVTSSSGAGAQSYPISTTAYDTAATSIQSTVQGSYIIATPDSTPPTVSIMSPANSSSVSGTVEFSASASDNMGIAKVEFRVGTTLIGTDTSAPYSIKWNTRKYSGSQTLTATAYDTAGNSTVSAPVTVTVTGSRGRK